VTSVTITEGAGTVSAPGGAQRHSDALQGVGAGEGEISIEEGLDRSGVESLSW